MPLGGLVTLLVLLPNLLMLIFPPQTGLSGDEARGPLHRVMEGIERAGQALSFLIPFFYRLPFIQYAPGGRVSTTWAAAVMALVLVFYYAGWVRYIAQGRCACLLFEPMLGVPIPMALAPVLYFAAAAVMFRSLLLAFAAVLLAVGHLFISQQSYERCLQSGVKPFSKTSI